MRSYPRTTTCSLPQRPTSRLTSRSLPIAAACAAAVLLAAGCSKTDDPPMPMTQSAPSSIPPGSMSTPTLPTGTLPDPIVPKEPTLATPAPGQANDHSSPAFKDGGKPDPNK